MIVSVSSQRESELPTETIKDHSLILANDYSSLVRILTAFTPYNTHYYVARNSPIQIPTNPELASNDFIA